MKRTLFLTAFFCCVLFSNAQQKTIEYTGTEIDFGTLKIGSLQKGSNLELIANDFNIVDIHTAVSKEHNLWTLT